MNGVPAARQNSDRPRRVARRESNPTASARDKPPPVSVGACLHKEGKGILDKMLTGAYDFT